ncbi:mpv17-like protein [Syngnathus typhle]
MYWPFMQLLNFALLPLHMRTAFMGCCAFLWATFLCFSRQDGDGTAGVALAFVMDPRKTLEEMRQARLARKRDRQTKTDN